VFAHPDDESLACGGTLARLSDGGTRVVLMCASRGERGGPGGPVRSDDLGRARSEEMREAAAALGIADVVVLDHPDGDLRWAEVSELHAEIVFAVQDYAPDAVITFGEDGLYWHQDHIAIHERTTTALRTMGAAAPPLYFVTMPRGVMRPAVEAAVARGWTAPAKGFWSLPPDAFGLAAAPPTLIVDVQEWVPRKLAALRAHHSQMGAGHPFWGLTDEDAKRWLGTEHFHRAPESARTASVLEAIAALA
jgi:LmbE family N-acetylglucosaminyl deacetylase